MELWAINRTIRFVHSCDSELCAVKVGHGAKSNSCQFSFSLNSHIPRPRQPEASVQPLVRAQLGMYLAAQV